MVYKLVAADMEFRTIVKVEHPGFQIEPLESILFVGSCFADHIGRRFAEEHFPVTVNPFGVMYNPASILHTVLRCDAAPRIAFFTLGTNHVYRLKVFSRRRNSPSTSVSITCRRLRRSCTVAVLMCASF